MSAPTTPLPEPAAVATATLTLTQALNQKIRQYLEEQEVSQRAFAERLGVTQGAISYLLAEKRRASTLDFYERLARVFGVSLSVLIADLEQRIGHGPAMNAAMHAHTDRDHDDRIMVEALAVLFQTLSRRERSTDVAQETLVRLLRRDGHL